MSDGSLRMMQIRVTPEEHERLRAAAYLAKMPMAKLVRVFVEEGLDAMTHVSETEDGVSEKEDGVSEKEDGVSEKEDGA